MCDRRPPEATVRYSFQIDKSWIDRNQRRSAPGDDWSGIETIVEPDFGELHVDAGGTSIAGHVERPDDCGVLQHQSAAAERDHDICVSEL